MTNRSRPLPKRPIVASLCLSAHGAALVVLLALSAWKIDKLPAATTPISITSAHPLPAASTPEQGPPKAANKARSTRASRQRTALADTPATAEAAVDDGSSESGTGGSDDASGVRGDGSLGIFGSCQGPSCLGELGRLTICGDGQLDAGEQCDDNNLRSGDGCSSSCQQEAQRVAAQLIEGRRIHGDAQIAPPAQVTIEMHRSGIDRTTAAIEMCLNRRGAVASVRVLRSSGYAAYDDKLVGAMGSWRYQPYMLDSGVAVPVCTVVTFIYRVE